MKNNHWQLSFLDQNQKLGTLVFSWWWYFLFRGFEDAVICNFPLIGISICFHTEIHKILKSTVFLSHTY